LIQLAADRSATQAPKEARDDRAFYLVALMAAIVTTLAYVPVGALVALLAFGAFDVPLHSLLTFGGQIHIVAGLALWWGIAYLPALLYAAACMRT
jgi:hypothetical protein